MIMPINSNQASDGGFLQFSLGTGSGSGWLEPGTLAFYCTLTFATSGATDDLQGAWPTNSLSCVIDRITVSVGGAVIEQCANYNAWNSILLSHCSNDPFINHDLQVSEGCGESYTAAGSTYARTIMIPLNIGVLNTAKAMP